MKEHRNLSIRSRLLLAFGFASILVVIVAGIGINSLHSLGQNLTSMAERDRLLQTGAIELRLAVEQESDVVRGYLLTGNPDFLNELDAARSDYQAKMAELRRLGPTADVAKLLSDVDGLHSRFVGIASEQTALRDMSFGRAAVFLWQTQGNEIKNELNQKLVELVSRQDAIIAAHTEQARTEQNRTLNIAIILVVVGLGAITLAWFWTSRSITRPVQNLVRATEEIGKGKLDTRVAVNGNDELGLLGRAMNDMVAELEESRKLAETYYREEQKRVATEERQRLARDLHDAVSQTLFSASLIAEVLPTIWERNRDEAFKRLEEIRQLTRGALAEMRTLLLELRPAALVDAEIGELLQQLAESVTGRARLPVTLQIDGQSNLTPEVKVALYRIAQEALNNVAKHSGATQALLYFRGGPENVFLSVVDNGRGFDAKSLPHRSLGMGIMQERARDIGANLKVDSTPGQGTRITLEWPGVPKEG